MRRASAGSRHVECALIPRSSAAPGCRAYPCQCLQDQGDSREDEQARLPYSRCDCGRCRRSDQRPIAAWSRSAAARPDHVALQQHEGPLREVVQLATSPGQRCAHSATRAASGDGRQRPGASAVPAQRVLEQRPDVAGPVAQRRDLQREDAQPGRGPRDPPFAHQRPERAYRSRDHPDVQCDRARTQPLDFALADTRSSFTTRE